MMPFIEILNREIICESIVHPSTKVMADFYSNTKSTRCPHPISMVLVSVWNVRERPFTVQNILTLISTRYSPQIEKRWPCYSKWSLNNMVDFMGRNLTNWSEIFQTPNVRRFLNLTQISWRLVPPLVNLGQTNDRISKKLWYYRLEWVL